MQHTALSFEAILMGRGFSNPQSTCEPVEPAHIQGQKSSFNRRNRPSLYGGPLVADCSCSQVGPRCINTLPIFSDDALGFAGDKQSRIKANFRGVLIIICK